MCNLPRTRVRFLVTEQENTAKKPERALAGSRSAATPPPAGLKRVKQRDGIPEGEQVRRALAHWLKSKGALAMALSG